MTTLARDPTVSVVIPLYNAQDVIVETIESVLKQTWTDYEVVVVDDGSTDGSRDIVLQYGDRIRYVYQANRGVACARNRGIAESRGRYIALLDHDDLWDAHKLEKQVAVLEQHPEVGLVITDVGHLDRAGKPLGLIGQGYNSREEFARLFVRGYLPTPSSSMIRRSVLDKVGGFDESFNSAGLDDHELWTRIAAEYEIMNIAEPLTFHRNREVKPAHIALDHRPILIAALLERYGQDPERRRYLLKEKVLYFADQGKYLVKSGQRAQGRGYLLQGLLLSLREVKSLKGMWRCASRLARSFL